MLKQLLHILHLRTRIRILGFVNFAVMKNPSSEAWHGPSNIIEYYCPKCKFDTQCSTHLNIWPHLYGLKANFVGANIICNVCENVSWVGSSEDGPPFDGFGSISMKLAKKDKDGNIRWYIAWTNDPDLKVGDETFAGRWIRNKYPEPYDKNITDRTLH